MKGAPLPSAHVWSSSWAEICFCRYGSANCPRLDQSLLKEHKQQLKDLTLGRENSETAEMWADDV